MHSGVVSVQIKQVVIVNNGHAEFAQPSLATEDVARQVWKFGEVDEAFKDKGASLDNYFMAESLYRDAECIKDKGLALFNLTPQPPTDLVTEKADFTAS